MPKKIVVVDDDSFMLDVIKVCLADICDVAMTDDSRKAVALIEAEKPDMVILDLLMPGVTGLDILTKLRHTGSMMPVLMLTSLGEINIAGQALALGACEVMTKPFDPQQLRRTVELKLSSEKADTSRSPCRINE